MSLLIKNLHAGLEDGTPILKGLSLEVPAGEVHAIMGPNGSGKSTLSKVVAGHDSYQVTGGTVTMDGDKAATGHFRQGCWSHLPLIRRTP